MSDIVFPDPAVPSVAAPVEPPPEPLVKVEGFHVDFMANAVKMTLPSGESKLMSYMDAIPVFREFFVSKESDGTKSKSTLLPPNVYAFDESHSQIKLGMYFPEGKQMIQYGAQKPVSSIVPNIVVVAMLKKIGQDFEIGAVKYYSTSLMLSEFPLQFASLEAGSHPKIGLLPFTNTYPDHRMCYGQCHMPRVFKNRDLRELYWYYAFLWNSPFNDDLGISALHNAHSSFRNSHKEWYAHLGKLAAENKPFPYSEIGL